MVTKSECESLNIVGHPAEFGLYKSLLASPGIHQVRSDDTNSWYFGKPSISTPRGQSYLPLWEDFEEFLILAEAERLTFKDLYDRWRQPPFGLTQGVLPILAVAHVMAYQDELALYLDGTFTPTIDKFFIDRLLQSPRDMGLQRFRISSERREVLKKIADVVARSLKSEDLESPLEIAKPLAKFAYHLHPWVKRTKRLDKETIEIRDVLLGASDPNVLLFIDLPRACGLSEDIGEQTSPKVVDQVVKKLRNTIAILESAHARMLESLAETVSSSFGLGDLGQAELIDLGERGEHVAGLSGDLRLDAFSRRLAADQSRIEWLEGLGGLVANKPVRDWTDADLDRAKIELVGLVKRFERVEKITLAQAHDPQTISINGAISQRGSAKEIDIAVPMSGSLRRQVLELDVKIRQLLDESDVENRIKLAAIASSLFHLTPDMPATARSSSAKQKVKLK